MSQKKYRQLRIEEKLRQSEKKSQELRKRIIISSVSIVALIVVIAASFGINSIYQAQQKEISASKAASGTNSGDVPSKDLAQNAEHSFTMKISQGVLTGTLFGSVAPQAVSSWMQLATDDWYPKHKAGCPRITTMTQFQVLMCGSGSSTNELDAGYRYGPIEKMPEQQQEEAPKGSGTIYSAYPKGFIAMSRDQGKAYSQGTQFFIVWGDTFIQNDTAGPYTIVGKLDDKSLELIQTIAKAGIKDDATNTEQSGEPKEEILIKSLKIGNVITQEQMQQEQQGTTSSSSSATANTSSSSSSSKSSSKSK